MQMTGAEIIINLLERQGVTTIAGIPGGANLPIYDALGQSTKIRHVLTRHEQGAGFLAQGMARVTGEPAVCMATSGPGAVNLITALADAKLDSVPLVCITGQVPSSLMGTDAFQEVDTYGLSIPVTKHNFLVQDAADLLFIIPEAFRIAASGRPGPVLVDVPKNVQTQMAEFDAWPAPGRKAVPPCPAGADLDFAAELINDAKRPVLYLGGGVINADAAPLALEMAEKAGIPATMTLMGLGAMPTDHPLSLGMLGMHAAPCTNYLLAESDLLIALGSRFDDRATGKVAEFCPHAAVIHVDIDKSELGKIRAPQISIRGDIREVLEELMPRVAYDNRLHWRSRITRLKREFPLPAPHATDTANPYGLIREAAKHAGQDAIVATDVGQHQMWTAQAYPFSRPRRWLTSGGLGTMGFGLPTALGAALAEPDAKVVLFSGDGSLLMNIQELATLAQERANVTIVLMDNGQLGLVRQQQDLFYGRRTFASSFSHRPDFAAIAAGFGIKAYDLESSKDPARDMAEAFAHEGPSLVRAPISNMENVYPMVPPGAANTEMIQGESHAASIA